VSPFVWNLTLDLSDKGDPTSSHATAGIALEIMGSHKPSRHDKADTPSASSLYSIQSKMYHIILGRVSAALQRLRGVGVAEIQKGYEEVRGTKSFRNVVVRNMLLYLLPALNRGLIAAQKSLNISKLVTGFAKIFIVSVYIADFLQGVP
jgi:hypothetical protein